MWRGHWLDPQRIEDWTDSDELQQLPLVGGCGLGRDWVTPRTWRMTHIKDLIQFVHWFSGEGNGNRLHYSCLGNPMDRGAWRTQSMGLDVTKQTTTKHYSITAPLSLEQSRPREHCPTVECSLSVLSSMEVTSSLWLLGLWSVASVRNWSVCYI